MEPVGIIFEIKQLAVFDGPGIRTTVFLKGCPLRCQWCHNPEGLSTTQELMRSQNGCTQCGRCTQACQTPAQCTLCGACVAACPKRLRKICGQPYTSAQLAALLQRDAAYLAAQGGGVTFSGGEPTMQGAFLLRVLSTLTGMHRAIETCGHCEPALFAEILAQLDYIMMDLKLLDPQQHKQYTGVENNLILQNLEQLKASGKPFIIRIPMIPSVTDTAQNLHAAARLLQHAPALQGVELLPYHKTAGAKYNMVGRTYAPSFDIAQQPNLSTEIFKQYGIPCARL